jgi:hypothetical protein
LVGEIIIGMWLLRKPSNMLITLYLKPYSGGRKEGIPTKALDGQSKSTLALTMIAGLSREK